jgi:hypothetical protein
MAVRRFETFLVFLPIIAGAAFVGYATVSVHNASAQRNVEATNAGFSGSEDQDLAKAAGFVDSGKWLTHIAAAKADAEQKHKEWDAAAPQRTAAAAKEAVERVTQDASAKKAAAEEAERARLEAIPPGFRVSISAQSWKTGGFDSIGLMSFTLKNGNDYQVKDISIVCTFYGNSGTELGERTHTLYEIIRPRDKRTFSSVNIGFIPSQSSRGGCGVVSASRG